MGLTPLEYLGKNPKMSLKDLKDAYPNEDHSKLETIFNNHNSNASSTNSYSDVKSDVGSGAKEQGRSIGNVVVKGIQEAFTASESNVMTTAKDEFVTVNDLFNKVFTAEGKLRSAGDMFKGIMESAFNGIKTYYQQQSALITEVNTKTGLTGELSKQFREELTQSNISLTRFGISFEDLSNAATKLVSESGRFLLYNKESFDLFAKVGQAYVGNLEKLTAMLPEFEKVGIGGVSAATAIGDAGQKALTLGLNSQKVTGMIGENIGKLNQYGFKNGVEGLSAMTRKAIEFRTELGSAFSIAEKVMDPKGALEFSAKLQVIGGAIGDFGDPLKLMYMATNNVEGLQDAFIKAAGGLATYNAQQGKFEINSLNMRRVRDMAEATGQSVENLTKTAIAFQERAFAKNQLINLGLKPEQEEFITNLSRMEGGKMTIDLQGTSMRSMFADIAQNGKVTLDQVRDNKQLREAIIKNQDEFAKKTPEQIIASQASDVKQITRYVSFLVARARFEMGKTADAGIGKALSAAFGVDTDIVGAIKGKLASGEVKMKDLGEDVRKFIGANDARLKSLTANATKNENDRVNLANTAEAQMKKDKQANATTTANTNNPQEVKHTVEIKAPALMDGWSREMVRDSSIADSFTYVNPRSYTASEKK
jgi:hypothetical protein